MKTPIVSVCVPAFNQERTIAATLRSIAGQTFDNIEVIVADHSSSDRTYQIASSFTSDRRFRLYRFDGPKTIEASWNYVTSLARGSYLCLVPGDDFLDATAIEVKFQAFTSFPSAVMVATRKTVVDENGAVILSDIGLEGLDGCYSGAEVIRLAVRRGRNIFGEPGCVMVTAEAFSKIGSWRGGLPYLIDLATYFDILRFGDFVAIPASQAYFRLSQAQLSYRLLARQAQQSWRLHGITKSDKTLGITLFDLAMGNLKALFFSFGRAMVYTFLATRGRILHKIIAKP